MIERKRVFDFLVTMLILPVGLVLCLIFGFIFLIVNRENPIFIQVRVGRFCQHFNLYKLRTMRSTTKNVPTHLISSAEISMLGRVMRAIKVDEIPQLINVIRGEMSLVGPRPCLPCQEKLIAERLKLGVYEVLPGITGTSQIRGIDMSSPIELAHSDSEYLVNQNLRTDISVLVQTLGGKGGGDKTLKCK